MWPEVTLSSIGNTILYQNTKVATKVFTWYKRPTPCIHQAQCPHKQQACARVSPTVLRGERTLFPCSEKMLGKRQGFYTPFPPLFLWWCAADSPPQSAPRMLCILVCYWMSFLIHQSLQSVTWEVKCRGPFLPSLTTTSSHFIIDKSTCKEHCFSKIKSVTWYPYLQHKLCKPSPDLFHFEIYCSRTFYSSVSSTYWGIFRE